MALLTTEGPASSEFLSGGKSILLDPALLQHSRPADVDVPPDQAPPSTQEAAALENDLGVACHEAGRLAEAAAHYEQALALAPSLAAAHSNLGLALKALGRPIDAIRHHQYSLRLQPETLAVRINFADGLSDVPLARAGDSLLRDILETFSFSGVNHQSLACAGATLVRNSPPFAQLAAFSAAHPEGASVKSLLTAGLGEACADPLLRCLLRKTILRDELIESTLTQVRGALLDAAVGQGISLREHPALPAFVPALAQQCFLNEYVYFVSARENDQIARLRHRLTHEELPDVDRGPLVGILACYLPLGELQEIDSVLRGLSDNTRDGLAELLEMQVKEPREEKELRAGIATLGPIENEISRSVRVQYEENPYPRWLEVDRQSAKPVRRILHAIFPDLPVEQIPDCQTPEILIAGCGTGRRAINRAIAFRSSRVLAVDLSLSSLSYAKRKARELGIENIEFLHADLLHLGQLGRRFDIVESVGVLHHMDDPAAGWRVLTGCLKPGALMKIGLYSEQARHDIVAAQAFVAARGFSSNPDGIRECRRAIFALPEGAPERSITRVIDFYTLSETRDLIFHVQEKRFSIPQIAAIVERLGLRFLGFELEDPALLSRYRERFPDDPAGTSLRNWHTYELEHPSTFLSLYLFWLQNPAR